MQEWLKSDNHPFISLLYLFLLAIGGAFLFTLLGLAFSIAVFGVPSDLGELLTGQGGLSLKYLKIIQIFSSVGMFLLPPLILARIESNDVMRYLKLNKKTPGMLLGISAMIMFTVMPLLDLTVELNQNMKLPEFLTSLEEWMRNKERELEVLTKQFLTMTTYGDLALNLFMIAVLPAISEELMFRGCLQRIFSRWFGSYHSAIWIAAVIFSAIHVQFYGFIPRMLLGALFGYLLVWSNSIWIPILAHFINNGVTVIAAFVYQRKGLSLDKMTEPGDSSPAVYLASIVGTALLLYAFYKSGLRTRENERRVA